MSNGPTAAPETSSGNSTRTPCKNPKTKNQYSFHRESLKSFFLSVLSNFCPVWAKFCKTDLHTVLLSICEFHENRRSEVRTFFVGVNE